MGTPNPDPTDLSPADLDAAAQFLRQMLAHVDDTWGNDRTSFKFFRDHLTELQNEALVAVVPLVFRELTAPDANRSTESIATDFLNLGVDLSEFPLGNRALNLELAIAAFEATLAVYTREAFPADWAGTQNNLGIAYGDRIRGERAENLERAIAAYEAALAVRTREAFPADWAMTQNNLGNAYGDRIRGERAENLEQAIAAYEAALAVRTREAFPANWATTQNNLGSAYGDRIRGERADNLERAIAAYEAALTVYTREAFPADWAMTQNNLGNAYSARIRGERADNLERAIAAYEAALAVYTREAFPANWATTQNNLGTAYKDRIRGERADNLEQAIAAYEAALAVRTREAFPADWAMTQNNLGIAYKNRIRGERAENLELAIAAYEAALAVYTREAFPADWAMTQNNLGTAYKNRIRGERAENLERAIAAYEAALTIYTREAFPADWAATQGNLVAALVERFKLTGAAEDLDAAIAGLEAAVELAVPGTDVYATNLYILGNALEYRHSLHSAVVDLAQATAAYGRAAATTPWPDRQRRYTTKAADSEYALGVALSQQGQWYESLEHLDTSLGLYREVGSRLGRADALQQVGRTHYLMGNFDKARIHLRDALRLYQAEENLPGEAACHAGLGRLLLRLNFIDDAIAELEQACAQYRSLGDHTHLEELQAVYTLAQKVKEKQPL